MCLRLKYEEKLEKLREELEIYEEIKKLKEELEKENDELAKLDILLKIYLLTQTLEKLGKKSRKR